MYAVGKIICVELHRRAGFEQISTKEDLEPRLCLVRQCENLVNHAKRLTDSDWSSCILWYLWMNDRITMNRKQKDQVDKRVREGKVSNRCGVESKREPIL